MHWESSPSACISLGPAPFSPHYNCGSATSVTLQLACICHLSVGTSESSLELEKIKRIGIPNPYPHSQERGKAMPQGYQAGLLADCVACESSWRHHGFGCLFFVACFVAGCFALQKETRVHHKKPNVHASFPATTSFWGELRYRRRLLLFGCGMDTGLSTHAYCVEVYIREEWSAFDSKKQHKAGDNLDGFGGTSIGGRYTTNGFSTGVFVEGYAISHACVDLSPYLLSQRSRNCICFILSWFCSIRCKAQNTQ